MRSRSRSTCSRIPIGWSVERPPSRSGKWVMSVAWNRCVMRCATVTGKFGKLRSKGWGRLVLPPSELLIKLLRDWDVRKYAIAALGKIRDERVLDPLMLQLRNDEFKDDAVNALVELGEPALSRLIKALKDKDENVRKQAVLALGRIKHVEAIDPLIDMLADSDWFTRLTSAAALEAIGDDRGRDAIKPLMKDPDMVVRMRVERILAKWKKQPATT